MLCGQIKISPRLQSIYLGIKLDLCDSRKKQFDEPTDDRQSQTEDATNSEDKKRMILSLRGRE